MKFLKTSHSLKRYKQKDGFYLIEIRIKNVNQLFDARDPAPFRERDLDDDFVEYILTSSRELSEHGKFKIVIYVEEDKEEASKLVIQEAIQTFLNYQIELQIKKLNYHLKTAQIFFMIGLVVLFASIGFAQTIKVPETPGIIGILREGIVIFGWVSMWRPIELILFDWYPLYENLKSYRKLESCTKEIHFTQLELT